MPFQGIVWNTLFGLDCNLAESLKQHGRNLVCIAESRLEILMRQSLAHHIRIAAHGHLKRGVGVAEAMKGEYWNWRKKGDEDKT